MSKSKIFNIILLMTFIASPLFGGAIKAEAQVVQPVSSSSPLQVQASAVNDEIGTSNAEGQMRTTTMAMRIATALHLDLVRQGTTDQYAGINPDTSQYSPLAKLGGELAQMVTNIALPDYFGDANWANSALPKLDATGAVIPGTGIRKFVDTLPGLCGVSAPNAMGQCIPVGVPDTTTFAGSDYYEIAVVEYRERMSPDLPATGTKLRGYVQVVPANYPGAVALTTINGLTKNILDRNGLQVYGATKPHYLGPLILSQGCDLVVNPASCKPVPVRLKFTNYLPTGPGGVLFLPTDTTYMGAGMGPGGSITHINLTNGGSGYTAAPAVAFTGGAGTGAAATATVINGVVTAITITSGGLNYTSAPVVSLSGGGGTGAAATAILGGQPGDMYTQNRATLHLHGGDTPWISDGTPHQWTTPYGEATSYSKGESVAYVPDMWFDANGNLYAPCAGLLTCPGYTNDPGLGSLTFYWTNQQSGRLLFYHDHSYGITRLNVYAGEAAGYLIADPVEEQALAAAGFPGTIPDVHNLAAADLAHLIPLVIQDKTFVPDNGVAGGQLAATDPTWDTAAWGSAGDLWFPHVYIPNQNPADITGANAFGRWDYGPWFWPPQDPSTFVPSGQPYQCTSKAYPPGSPPAFPPLICPGTPNPSGTPEGFMDTPVINGALYPTLTVDPTSYRFQMLMAGNDRTWNLGLYVADPLSVAVTKGGSNYTLPPIVGFSGGGGTGAAAVAKMSNGSVTSILITGVGSGYTVTPNVKITGNGTGAAAKAVIDPVTKTVKAINITSGGFGYTSALVAIDPPLGCVSGCVTATATATVTPPGTVLNIVVTNPGSGYTSNPTVTFTNAAGDSTGAGAAAIASINSEMKMVESAPPEGDAELPLCAEVTQTSGAMLALATLDASGNPINGTGLPAGCWPTTWPTDGRDGGVPDPLTAGPPFIQVGTESGLLPSPVVIPSTPVGYEYNRRSITVLNIYTHGLLLGPAERADVMVDFSQFAGKTLLLYNDAPAPVPAFDPRNDYYTGDPDQTMAGGAPTTLPGYGPNTRTIMQIKVKAVAGGGTGSLGSVTVTNVGAGYSAPTVSITGGGGINAAASASGSVDKLVLTSAGSGYVNPVISFLGGGGSGASATFNSGALSGLTLTNSGAGYAAMPTITFTGGGGSLAAATASGSVDAVALAAGGSGYANTNVSLLGGGGTGATALATGGVNAIAVTNGGGGYSAIPTISFTGGGGGINAAATATGGVDAVAISNAGGGYAVMPGVSFTNALGDTGIGAAASATGSVDAIALVVGAGYVSPVVALTGNATASVSGGVDGLKLVSGGTGYGNPQVAFSGGGGTGAAATAILGAGGVITGFTITNPGSGYTSAPAVAISDLANTGTGASATSTISISVITITAQGSGYANAPTVTITDNSGQPGVPATPASATATLKVTGVTITAAGTGYKLAPTPAFSVGTAVAGAATLLVNAITVTTPGSGYTTAPAVVFSLGTAAANATLTITALSLGVGGTGYASAPTVSFTGGGTGATGTATLKVSALTITSPGSGYTSAPTVVFSGGAAAATASISATGLKLISGGSGYTSAPQVVITDSGGGTGAVAVATINVNSITLTNPGSGYTSLPTVTVADTAPGTGTGATAVANMAGGTPVNLTTIGAAVSSLFTTQQGRIIIPEPQFPAGNGGAANPTYLPIQATSLTGWFTGQVGGITLTNPGSGYSSAPAVSLQGGGGTGASAALTFGGSNVNSLSLTAGGTGYTTAPTVAINGGGGTGATASATITNIVNAVAVTRGGSGYTLAPTVAFTGGGGAGAAATATITNAVNRVNVSSGGSGYTTAPTVVFTGGGGSGAAATAVIQGGRVSSVTVTNGGSGYTSAPAVSFTGGGGTGAAATATITGVVASVTVTNGGSGYTGVPAVSFSGGGGTGARATASITGVVNGLLLTNGGTGYTANPTVSFSGGGGTGAAASAAFLPGYIVSLVLTNPGSGYTSAPTVVFTGGGTPVTPAAAVANAPSTPLAAKAIQELFTLDYGRMNATLGVELPFTNFFIQTTIPYGYIDPPTEMFKDGDLLLWKITHNGVDTHFIHFHLYDVQVINRVGWDGMIKPPDVNEVAWKDTVRMNPLEDIIIALRPMKQTLPFELPNSIRPLDVTEPIGASNPNNTMGFANIDPTNQPAPVTNDLTNYGWEYVVHCHILGHEENDMMRSQLLAIPPDPVTNVTATLQGGGNTQSVLIQWVDGSINETGFTVQRATTPSGPWLALDPQPPAPGRGTAMSYVDTTIARRTTYYYQVVANNVVGYTKAYAAPAAGYPNLSADSVPVAAPAPITTLSTNMHGPIFADSFETGLNLWSGLIGASNVSSSAVIGPNGGALGMVAKINAQHEPAYVYDILPSDQVNYDGNFYFNPNKVVTSGPVDIFVGLDQAGQPIFGVQYQGVDLDTIQLRAWLKSAGGLEYTSWQMFINEPGEDEHAAEMTHKVDVAWLSGANGGISFYVDDNLVGTLRGNTSASQVAEVILGPSLGLSAGDAGSMYFDEFTSSSVIGLSYRLMLPTVSR